MKIGFPYIDTAVLDSLIAFGRNEHGFWAIVLSLIGFVPIGCVPPDVMKRIVEGGSL